MQKKEFSLTLALCTAFVLSLFAVSFESSTVAASEVIFTDLREQLLSPYFVLHTSADAPLQEHTTITSIHRSAPMRPVDRVQYRLNRRLSDIQQRNPEEYERVITILRRRERRQNARLEDRQQAFSLRQRVVDGVNMERAKLGIPILHYHHTLELSAQHHAQDMFDREYFSHENAEGQRSGDRIKAAGYGVVNAQECLCSYKVFLGENIAKGQTTVEQVIREWMASKSHKEAMLSRDYNEIGVGIVDDIWVLNFGGVLIDAEPMQQEQTN